MAFKGVNPYKNEHHASDGFHGEGLEPTYMADIRTTMPRQIKVADWHNEPYYPPYKGHHQSPSRAHAAAGARFRRRQSNRINTKTRLIQLAIAKRELLRRHQIKNRLIVVLFLSLALSLGLMVPTYLGPGTIKQSKNIWHKVQTKLFFADADEKRSELKKMRHKKAKERKRIKDMKRKKFARTKKNLRKAGRKSAANRKIRRQN